MRKWTPGEWTMTIDRRHLLAGLGAAAGSPAFPARARQDDDFPPPLTEIPSDRLPAVRADYLRKSAALFAAAPDLSACRAGVLKGGEKQKALATVNDVRARHGLGAVAYDLAFDDQVMQTALMMAANNRLDHNPGGDWACYSAAGHDGAASSNLHGGAEASPDGFLNFLTTPQIVAGWITDARNALADNIGHRRLLLDPFLKHIAFGRYSGLYGGGRLTSSAALKVIFADMWSDGHAGPFVAWPYGDYPAHYFDPAAFLSFSVVADLADKTGNEAVDFRGTRVTVTPRGGAPLALSRLSSDNAYYGLPNNIQFLAAGIMPGVAYEVSLRHVGVKGVDSDFSYGFRIVA